jgi:hypothetical protein
MTKTEVDARRAVVDEYAELLAALAPLKPKQARVDELAKAIRSWYDSADETVAHVALGDKYQVTAGAKGMQTVIDTAGAVQALGRKKLVLAVSFTLKALNEYLPEAIVAMLTTKEQTGSRSLTVQPMAEPVAKFAGTSVR